MATDNLVIQTAFVGDALLSIPLIKAVRRLDPARKLVLMCRKPVGDFFLKTNLVDEVVAVDKARKESLRQVRSALQAKAFHWVISPHESVRTAFLARTLKAEKKIAFGRWWNTWAFDQRLQKPDLPEALRQLALAAPLGFQAEFEAVAEPWSRVTPSRRPEPSWPEGMPALPEWASMKVALPQPPDTFWPVLRKLEGKRVVIVAPGSVWATKMWTVEGFAEVARSYQSQGAQVVFVGAGAEVAVCAQLSREVPGSLDLSNQTTLFELAHLFARSQLLFCNDSGAMHLAAVTELPTVAMFGPTTLEFGYRPWQQRAFVVQGDHKCRPCGKHGAKHCPLGTHVCMTSIKAADVLTAAQKI